MEQLTEDAITKTVPPSVIDFALASTYAEIKLRLSADPLSDEERGGIKCHIPSPQQREQDMLWESYVVGWPWVITSEHPTETTSGSWIPSNVRVGYISHFSNHIRLEANATNIPSLTATYPQFPPFSMVLSSPTQPNLVLGLCRRSTPLTEDVALEIRRRGLTLAAQRIDDWISRETTKAVYYSLPSHDALHRKRWHARAVEKLEKLAALPDDWNGYGAHAPNETAIHNATQFLEELATKNLEPSRILASAADGVSLCFFRSQKYAEIECYNTGESIAIIKNTSTNWREIWEAKSDLSSIERIQDFLESAVRQ